MKIIKQIEQDEYLIIDVILIILVSSNISVDFRELHHEILRCGIFLQYPLLLKVLNYMKENNLLK